MNNTFLRLLQNPLWGQITAAETGGSALIRAVMDVPKRKEAGGTQHLGRSLFVGGKTKRERRSEEVRRTERNDTKER